MIQPEQAHHRAAVFDWLLHYGHIINIHGNSYRLKVKLKAGISSTPDAQMDQNYSDGTKSNEFWH